MTSQEHQQAIQARLDAGDARMRSIEKMLAENTALTRELLDAFQVVKGGVRTLGWIGRAARWISYIAGAALALIGIANVIKTGAPPPPHL